MTTQAQAISGMQSKEQSGAPDLVARFHQLRDVLSEHERLWRPAPFHELQPAWTQQLPGLTVQLMRLSDESVSHMARDDAALMDWLQPHVPALGVLRELTQLPQAGVAGAMPPSPSPHLSRDVSGRKQSQIAAFANALAPVRQPLLEWCAGKGHLGRLLASQHGVEVCSLELDSVLVDAGRALAARAGVQQTLIEANVLAPASSRLLAGRHGIALHACGDLHMALLRGAVAQQSPALDVVPCCYCRMASPVYVPLNADAGLQLTRDELHLAVTGTVTSSVREQRLADRAQAWKLAFLEWRAKAEGVRGKPFASVPARWLREGFSGWMRRLCAREGMALPDHMDWSTWEQAGWQRFAEVRRLELVRLAFRRALELWLVLDRAVYLQRHGYVVRVQTFCDRSVTPRNILISARRAD